MAGSMNVKNVRIYPSSGLFSALTEGIKEDVLIPYYTGASYDMAMTTAIAEYSRTQVAGLVGMNPYKSHNFSIDTSASPNSYIEFIIPTGMPSNSTDDFNMNYFALLGHNLADINGAFTISAYGLDVLTPAYNNLTLEPILNCSVAEVLTSGGEATHLGHTVTPKIPAFESGNPGDPGNGTLIVKIDHDLANDYGSALAVRFFPADGGGFSGTTLELGSFCYGTYYDMPRSPDLSYSLDFIYDGVKTKRSKAGSDFINVDHYGRPLFLGKYKPFTSRETGIIDNPATNPTGRRVWGLKYSQLKGEFDIGADYQADYEQSSGFLFPQNIWSTQQFSKSNDFYFRVLHQTLGGKAPFLFEFDNSVLTTSDDYSTQEGFPLGDHFEGNFSIAKFKRRSTKFSHKSHKFYDFQMQVEESW